MNLNSAIFISDLHIDTRDKERYNKILSFLRGLKGNTEYLFLLGDIFEFWYGDRSALLNEYREVINTLEDLSKNGVKLYVFEGNHDICYGKYFRDVLKANVYRKCTTLNINNYKVFLGHGDELVKNDVKYLFLRSLLRLSFVKFIITKAPSKLVLKIALYFAYLSRKAGLVIKHEIHESYKEVAEEKFKEGIEVLILGHAHIPESVKIGKGLYINCGNWLRDFSYVEFKDNTFSLKRYN